MRPGTFARTGARPRRETGRAHPTGGAPEACATRDRNHAARAVRRCRVVPSKTLVIAPAALAAVILLAGSPGNSSDERPIEERCETEIVELHQFLEEWSNAELPDTNDAFARFGDVIAPSFVIIDPDGSVAAREPIVEAIRAAHGRWRDAPGKIRIENYRLHHHGGGLALATYEEWHELPGGTVARLSSVLFGANDAAPNGLEWLHLHEVWVPGHGPQGRAR